MRTGVYVQSSWLPQTLFDIFWCPLDRHMRRLCHHWIKRLHKEFTDCVQNGGAGHFTSLFGDDFGARKEKAGKELEAEARSLITAGTETSAIGVASVFFYLARHAKAYERLADEIRHTFSDIEQIRSGTRLTSCTYLYACIYEALRMSPPTVGCMWREVEEGGIHVDGMFIPAGYDIGSCIYALHHNENHYPDPFSYIPERWLRPSAEIEKALRAFCPFSFGPRGCPGRSLAMLEMSIVVARVLWLMDFRECPDINPRSEARAKSTEINERNKNEYQLISGVTSSSQGPLLQFKQRQLLACE
ncbi:hypothetical protein ACLMJK_006328 [Lecanora helva]